MKINITKYLINKHVKIIFTRISTEIEKQLNDLTEVKTN